MALANKGLTMRRIFIFTAVLAVTALHAAGLCAQTPAVTPVPTVPSGPPSAASTPAESSSQASELEPGEPRNVAADSEPATEKKETEPRYIRVHQNEQGKPQSLQTSIVRYEGKPNTPYAGQIVDLVGVVHIGQREYYVDLNQRLAKYDTVLYELVAPDGTRIRPADLQERRSLLASMQTGMKDMLNLEYQLELIDYLAKNFRHADMSPDEFAEDLERRGDSIWKMAARMMGAGLATSATTGGDAGMLLALFSNDRSKMMKQTMARQLVDIEAVTAGMDDASGDNTLIKGRNAKAFEILKEELQKGKQLVAVFYGAGHLPDMAERLENDFQMQFIQTTWMDAWDLTRN